MLAGAAEMSISEERSDPFAVVHAMLSVIPLTQEESGCVFSKFSFSDVFSSGF